MIDKKLSTIARRLDAFAIEQLRSEVVRLAQENENLRRQLSWAEDSAELWRQDAMDMQLQLCAETNSAPGITITGQLALIAGQSA
jgi:hypothetical protein